MENTIQCDIVSAHEPIFSGDVAMFIATGTSGELGIAPRHAPLMTTLKPGPIRVVKPDGEELVFFASGGILEVMPHLITLLADTAVRAADIDEAAAKSAMQEAERELASKLSDLEVAEAQSKLAEATAQLRVLEYEHKKTVRKR